MEHYYSCMRTDIVCDLPKTVTHRRTMKTNLIQEIHSLFFCWKNKAFNWLPYGFVVPLPPLLSYKRRRLLWNFRFYCCILKKWKAVITTEKRNRKTDPNTLSPSSAASIWIKTNPKPSCACSLMPAFAWALFKLYSYCECCKTNVTNEMTAYFSLKKLLTRCC